VNVFAIRHTGRRSGAAVASEYEGLTPKQIREMAPGWLIFRDGCPGGEAPEHVGVRVDRVIARSRAVEGETALFAHGHVLRVFVARWIGLPPGGPLRD
jgi:broad specificity phosphatase PhoE